MAKKQPKSEVKNDAPTTDKDALLKHYGDSEKTGVHDDFEVECDGKKTTMGALRKGK